MGEKTRLLLPGATGFNNPMVSGARRPSCNRKTAWLFSDHFWVKKPPSHPETFQTKTATFTTGNPPFIIFIFWQVHLNSAWGGVQLDILFSPTNSLEFSIGRVFLGGALKGGVKELNRPENVRPKQIHPPPPLGMFFFCRIIRVTNILRWATTAVNS